jgi:serine/threonine protein kinase
MDGMIGKSLGKYQIIEPLGEGGMATVYKAYDPSLERYVAIKIIRTVNQIDPDFLIRFQREARALAKLDHPYILKVLDYGEENGVPYLVMPYVSHGTLKKYTRGRMPYERAIGILLPVADALSYAHKRKIIHRDIKPANILFGESGEPILSDFGIAKMLDAGEQTQLTGTGLGIGTPAYMAPEQWNGIADERTDIYALGIVLYELITGRCPFQAETPAAILIKQVQDPLPRPKNFAPDLPDNVEALIFKALAKDPALRFQSMQAFMQAMNSILQGKTASFIVPPIGLDDAAATRVSQKPATIDGVPVMMEKLPGSKPKWLPWAIGGGGILAVGCIILIIVVVFSQSNFLNLKKATATVESLTQVELTSNEQGGTTEVVNKTDIAPEATSASMLQPSEEPQSATTIDNLPADIPVFTPNNGDVTTTTADNNLMFSYSTMEDNTTVETFFKEEMNKLGWDLISTTDMSAQKMVMYAFTKDDRNVVIYVMADQNKRTYIQIMLAS